MRLYSSIGPNPKVVRVFLAEKGLEPEVVQIDLQGGENRRPEFLRLNPRGQLPVLDAGEDGLITETIAICEYLEEKHPTPPLIGQTAAERARTRMWARRVDLAVCEPMANGFRYAEGHAFFAPRMPVYPEAADSLKAQARDGLQWIDQHLGTNSYLCGARFTLADILLHAAVRFFSRQGQPLDPSWTHLQRWLDQVTERPSTKA